MTLETLLEFVFANPLNSRLNFKVEKLAVLCDKELKFFNEYFSATFLDSTLPVTIKLAYDFADTNKRQVAKADNNMFFKGRMIVTKISVYWVFQKLLF